jgi:predicted DNA-binding protein
VVARAIESYVVSDDDAALWPERVTPALARELPSELADRLGMFCDQTGRAVRRVLRDGLSAMLSEHGWGLERVSVTIPADLADELDRLSETKGEDVRDIVVAAVASYLGVDISEVTNSNERDVNQLELFQVSR